MTLRERCVQLVSKIAYESELPREQVWAINYKKLNYRCQTCIEAIRDGLNLPSKLAVVEELDLLEDLYQILLDSLTAR